MSDAYDFCFKHSSGCLDLFVYTPLHFALNTLFEHLFVATLSLSYA